MSSCLFSRHLLICKIKPKINKLNVFEATSNEITRANTTGTFSCLAHTTMFSIPFVFVISKIVRQDSVLLSISPPL